MLSGGSDCPRDSRYNSHARLYLETHLVERASVGLLIGKSHRAEHLQMLRRSHRALRCSVRGGRALGTEIHVCIHGRRRLCIAPRGRPGSRALGRRNVLSCGGRAGLPRRFYQLPRGGLVRG